MMGQFIEQLRMQSPHPTISGKELPRTVLAKKADINYSQYIDVIKGRKNYTMLTFGRLLMTMECQVMFYKKTMSKEELLEQIELHLSAHQKARGDLDVSPDQEN